MHILDCNDNRKGTIFESGYNHPNYSFPLISGTALNRSATRPISATWKMGASASLLMATIVFESFIPAKCWMAPEIPTATYSSCNENEIHLSMPFNKIQTKSLTGATIFPVCPICKSLGTYPASTAARDAPTAPPSLSAIS